MAQSNIFSPRFGLQVPRGESLQSTEILCEGGLDLTQTVLETRPGFATALTNFEPSLTGGYRRISGYNKFSSTIVPGQGQVIGVSVFPPGFVIASRLDAVDATKYNTYSSTGTSWSKLNGATVLNYSSGQIVNSCYWNWTGTYNIAFTDGKNPAYAWDGTTFTVLNGAGSAADPKFCIEFEGYFIVAGYSSNKGAIKISAPLNATDWNTLDGAAEIVIGDEVTWLQVWRQQLIIFCRNSIYRMIGSSTNPFSSSPFTIQQITDRIGCFEGRTVREIDGDLLFLAPDGLRTISATFKIGDTDIGSISRPIQSIVQGINPSGTPCFSCVVRKKTQYRLFYNASSQTRAQSLGVMAAIRRFRDGHEDWEFSQIQGIQPSCADNGFWNSDGNEYVIHGGYDGYVYRQEQGGTWDGNAINELYKTVPLEFGDRGIRKVLHRITLYISTSINTSAPNLNLGLIYDLNKSGTVQPSPIVLTNVGQSNFNTYDSGATFDSGILWDAGGLPFIRQSLQGSGFLAQFQFTSNNATSSYVIQGFEVEYFPAARR